MMLVDMYNVFCQHYSCQKELEQACTNWDSLEQWYVLCAVLVFMSLNILFAPYEELHIKFELEPHVVWFSHGYQCFCYCISKIKIW